MDPSRSASSEKPTIKPSLDINDDISNNVKKSEESAGSFDIENQTKVIEREVIREEDLSQEDRVVIDIEKKDYSSHGRSVLDAKNPKTTIKEVIAKEEYIEENDGITIMGVVEREIGSESQSFTNSSLNTRVSTEMKQGNPPKLSTSRIRTSISDPKYGTEIEKTDLPRTTDEVPIGIVKPNSNQPRMHFNKNELDELASSIKKDGLLQPILVREVADGYEIIAGERRWQACKLAGMDKIPVRIKEADDVKTLELALIENLQRSDLNPIEEAYGYKRMMERGRRTQSEVAVAVSKGRSTIANALRLLDLPEDAQQLLYEEKITAGHARAILSIPTKEGKKKLTERLKKEKLSVREAESIARLIAGRAKASSQSTKSPTPQFYKTTAKSLSSQLDTQVRIRRTNGKNKLEIDFKDEEDLRRVLKKLQEQEALDKGE